MLGFPKHGGKDEENLTHFFRHYPGRQEFQDFRQFRISFIMQKEQKNICNALLLDIADKYFYTIITNISSTG